MNEALTTTTTTTTTTAVINNTSTIVNRPIVENCRADVRISPTSGKPLMRVCVLMSSYKGCDSDTKEYDDFITSPALYFPPTPGAPECDPNDRFEYIFDLVAITKKDVYSTVRRLVKSAKYDVYFNLCDGGKDEDRAGVEVTKALEEFKVPFTGSLSKCYEISKVEMKMWAHHAKIRTARHALIEDAKDIPRKCRLMTFPVIFKHPSGYGSVGMTKDCRCEDMPSLVERAAKFIETYQSVLIEEFITGEEVTVLACADSSAPDGVRVYPPAIITFPEGENFKHFNLKWQSTDMGWKILPSSHPSYHRVVEMGRKAFKTMMGGIGYGRSDIRLDQSGDPVFLEINANCGLMYPQDVEGSADFILRNTEGHQQFTKLMIQESIDYCERKKPAFVCDHDVDKGFYIKSNKAINAGDTITQRVSWDPDPDNWTPFNHSCEPNMVISKQTLNIIAACDIAVGEELTMDYRTYCDPSVPGFDCNCGTASCCGYVSFDRAPPVRQPEESSACNADEAASTDPTPSTPHLPLTPSPTNSGGVSPRCVSEPGLVLPAQVF